MKEIKLTGKHANGAVTLVDDEDYEELNKYIWNYHKTRTMKHAYVIRNSRKHEKDKGSTIHMHREIMQLNTKEKVVDHIDHNTLNNQKSNLRVCTKSENNANRSKPYGSSKYLGVHKHLSGGWQASCMKNKKLYTKYCKTEIEAAEQYNKLAIIHHKEFAKLNIII